MFFQASPRTPSPLAFDGRLRISGLANGRERELAFEQCLAFPKAHQVVDVGEFVKNRRGSALRLRALLEDLNPSQKARHVILRSFDAREKPVAYPLRALGERGLLVYAWDGKPLAYWHGGPFHLILPGFEAVVPEVPHLVSIEFAEAPSIAEPSPPWVKSRIPLEKAGLDYSVAFSMPSFAHPIATA